MSAPDPRTEYQNRLARLREAIASGDRRHLAISNARLALFAAAAAVAWLAFARAAVSPAWLLGPVLSFLVLLVVHARVLNVNDRLARARRYYERGVARLDDTWSGSGPDGSRFIDDHPYARDLDLFGPGSLFQLIGVARTEAGEGTLAEWLKAPATGAEVRSRQQAVSELRDRVDFRESLAVLAAETHVSRTGAMAGWAAAEPVGFGRREALLFAGCGAINVVVVTLMFAGLLGPLATMAWLTCTGTVALLNRRCMWKVIRRVDAADHDLALLQELLQRLERERFACERLVALQGALGGGSRPSLLLGGLRKYIAARDILRNEIARPFGLLLFVRSQSAVAIDRWHQQHRGALAGWIGAVGQFEALASFATFAFEHPSDVFPEIVETPATFRGAGLAHPLLPEHTTIRNDVTLGGEDGPRVLIVSGSNMSGKSTLLRAVGANTVLALAGAPVRASTLRVSPLALGATIRVEDSLQQGHSRFYTEILKIRDIVALARGERPALFLLDEILHGTNSHDRRIGAEAIVRSLVEAGAVGLVTTHDLALTQLADTLGGRAVNVHFRDRLEEGRMVFDYQMQPGVVTRSNALELMRAVGIDV